MDLLHFGDNKNWLGSLVSGQPDDLDLGLSEDVEVYGCRREAFGQPWHSMWA